MEMIPTVGNRGSCSAELRDIAIACRFPAKGLYKRSISCFKFFSICRSISTTNLIDATILFYEVFLHNSFHVIGMMRLALLHLSGTQLR